MIEFLIGVVIVGIVAIFIKNDSDKKSTASYYKMKENSEKMDQMIRHFRAAPQEMLFELYVFDTRNFWVTSESHARYVRLLENARDNFTDSLAAPSKLTDDWKVKIKDPIIWNEMIEEARRKLPTNERYLDHKNKCVRSTRV
jgi:hypothetical protein